MGSRSNENGLERTSGALKTLKLKFRRQLIRGESPKIDDYLNQVPKNLEMDLFGILLELEVRFRQQKGGAPTAEQYHRRYPRFAKPIRDIFFESTVDSDLGSRATDREDDVLDPPVIARTLELQQPDRLGDYSIVRKIGMGAMGEVYEACHLKTSHRVALKKLPVHFAGQTGGPNRLARFRKEFRSLCEVNHPNLVGMQTLEVDSDQWFFTMDLIEGEDFLSYVRPDGELDEKRLRSCLRQMAKGIIELHERGKLHRDLKPSNVMVTPGGHLFILDFGLVAEIQTDAQKTQTSSAIFSGTPPYAAPEQLGNQKTEANDWYGFGTMLYEALVGEIPFPQHGAEPIQLMLRKQQEDPPKLSGRSDLPADLCELADGLLQRDINLRFGAEAVIETLKLRDETEPDDPWDDPEFLREIVLVGRERQLAQLDSVKKEFLKNKKSTVVWVTGLSGEGKSSLIQKFLQSVRARDEMLIISGRCYDRESVPFKAIDSLVDSMVATLRRRDPASLSAFITPRTHLLLNAFPVLRQIPYLSAAAKPEISGLDNRQIQLLAFDALRDLWLGLGQQMPIVVFIDDLQWGDAHSAEMLIEMLTGDLNLPVLLLGSLRSDELGQSSFFKKWNVMREAGRISIPCHDVTVGTLDHPQRMDLLRSWGERCGIELGPEAEYMATESDGNPLFLELLFDSYRIKGDRSKHSGIPELISHRLGRLPPAASQMLNAVAIAGHACQASELAAVVGSGVPADSLLTRMRSEKLIRWTGSKDEYKVDTWHDKVRETILEQMPVGERQAAHLRRAEFIERQVPLHDNLLNETNAVRHPRLFDLAYHFLEAGDRRAFEYQLAAGQKALSAFAVEESLGYFENAYERLHEDVQKETRYALVLGLAYSTLLTGDCDGSWFWFEQARGYAQTPLEEARCLRGMAQGRLRSGQPGPATEYFRKAVRLLGDPEPNTMLGKLWQLMYGQFRLVAVPRLLSSRRDDVSSDRDLFLAELAGEFVMSLQTDFWGMAAYSMKHGVRGKFSSNHDSQVRGYTSCLHFYAVNGFGWLARRYRSWVQNNLASCQSKILSTEAREMLGEGSYLLGDLDLAEAELVETASKLKQFRSYHEGMSYHFLRHSASIRGRPALVDYWSQRELEYASRSGDEVSKAWAYYGMADGLSRAGQVEEAIQFAQKSKDILKAVESQTVMVADQELGRALLQKSEYGHARKVLSDSERLMSRLFLFPEIWVDTLPLLTEAMLGASWINKNPDRGQLKAASRMAFKSRLICNKFPTIKPHAMRVSGRAMAARGRLSAAKKFFGKAQEAAERIGAHYEQARALIDQSMLEEPDSKLHRQAGLELLESLGCVLPDAELEHLEIDRETHYGRARDARETDAKRMEFSS